MRRYSQVLMLAFLLCAMGTPARSGESLPDWFAVTPEVSAKWSMVIAPGEERVHLSPLEPPPGRPARILVLYTKKSSAYKTALSRVMQEFVARDRPVIFTVAKLPQEPLAWSQALARAKREGQELILTMGSAATAMAHHYLRGAALPVVSVCSKDPVLLGQVEDYRSGSRTNIAFTSLNVPVATQLSYLQKLRPALKAIAVLYAKQNQSAVTTQLEPLAKLAKKTGIAIVKVEVVERTQAKAELEKLMPQAVSTLRNEDPSLANSVFWVTGSTAVFREIDTINRLAEEVPVVSVVPDVVRAGDDSAVLSIGVGFESNAQIAAAYAIRILTEGVRPGALPVGVVSPPDIAINFRRARAIGLKLPFDFFEIAATVFNAEGELVRQGGIKVQ